MVSPDLFLIRGCPYPGQNQNHLTRPCRESRAPLPTNHLLCIALHCIVSGCIPFHLEALLWRTIPHGCKRCAKLASAASLLCASTVWRQHIGAFLSQTRAVPATPLRHSKPRTLNGPVARSSSPLFADSGKSQDSSHPDTSQPSAHSRSELGTVLAACQNAQCRFRGRCSDDATITCLCFFPSHTIISSHNKVRHNSSIAPPHSSSRTIST